MSTEIVTIASLAVGETGTIFSGKFAGREFRLHSIEVKYVLVDWIGSADGCTWPVRLATKVERATTTIDEDAYANDDAMFGDAETDPQSTAAAATRAALS